DMAVRIPGHGRHAPGARAFDLCPQLRRDLARAHAGGEQPLGELRERVETAVGIGEAAHRDRIAHRASADQIEVDADLEVTLGEGQGGPLLACRERHEQTGGPHHAAPMRFEDALVHARREAEIVGGDDEGQRPYTPRMAFQRMSTRSRSIRGVSLRKLMLVTRSCTSVKGISCTRKPARRARKSTSASNEKPSSRERWKRSFAASAVYILPPHCVSLTSTGTMRCTQRRKTIPRRLRHQGRRTTEPGT